MPELLLDQIRAQIRERLRALEPVAREHERLDAALTALGGPIDERPARRAPAPKPALAPKSRAGTSTSGRRPAAKRAPRGANRAAVLGVLAERPGVSASELSAAAGVGQPVLYALLKTLEQRGEVAKEQLPGGSSGYRLTPAAPSAAGSTPRGAVSS